jgi:hypothetical protein
VGPFGFTPPVPLTQPSSSATYVAPAEPAKSQP